MVLLLCLFFHFANGLATIFYFTYANSLAIFSNFAFANGFDTISNFTFESDFATISNFDFANGFNTIFILLSLVNLLLQNDAFLVRKVIFTSAAFGENCF